MKRTILAWMIFISSTILPNSFALVESEKRIVYNSNINNINNVDIIKNISNMNNIIYNSNYIYKYNNSNKTHASRSKRSFSFISPDLANAVRQVESHGNYKAHSRWSSACGAYQYIRPTWNNFGGYKTACKAPKRIQDRRMHKEILYNFGRYKGDWEKIIASHFYPKWANDKRKWNKRVPGNRISIRQYINKVKKESKYL
jgi:hypothetical protein